MALSTLPHTYVLQNLCNVQPVQWTLYALLAQNTIVHAKIQECDVCLRLTLEDKL